MSDGSPSFWAVLRKGVRLVAGLIAAHPWAFVVALTGALVYAGSIIASSRVIGWVTDEVVLGVLTEGADDAIVVTNPEVSSVRDSDRILGMLQSKSKRAEEGLEPVKELLLLTRYSPARVATGETVVGAVTVAGTAVAFAPGAALVEGENYRLRAGLGITDLVGHALAAPAEATFTAARSDFGAPPLLDAVASPLCAASVTLTGTTVPSATVSPSISASAMISAARPVAASSTRLASSPATATMCAASACAAAICPAARSTSAAAAATAWSCSLRISANSRAPASCTA